MFNPRRTTEGPDKRRKRRISPNCYEESKLPFMLRDYLWAQCARIGKTGERAPRLVQETALW